MSYCHHVVTLHVWLVFILALIVELPEEVESHHGVEIDDHGQQTHSQHKLEGDKIYQNTAHTCLETFYLTFIF